MIRLVVALFVVINVVVALFFMGKDTADTRETGVVQLPSERGDRLIMLSELDDSELRPLNQPVNEAPVDEQQSPESMIQEEELLPVCVLSGPFARETRARELADRIGALGVSATLLVETLETPGPIMVYTGPFASGQQAQRELRVLQASGLDSFVVADGELANAISLGVFRTLENARTQQDKIEQLGYQTQIYEYVVENDQYFINFSGQVLSAITEEYWANIANEYKDISIEQKACNEVASSGNFH